MENLEEKQNKKTRAIVLWSIVGVVVAAVAAWCIYNIVTVPSDKVSKVTGISTVIALLLGIFIISALGYLLGSITIKGVSLGTAGVFLVAIAFGCLCTVSGLKDIPILNNFYIENSTSALYKYYGSIVQNIGLVLFVASVGFIAGPSFFKN